LKGIKLSAKLKKEILKLLKERPLTLMELAELTETSPKKTFRVIRKLFENGEIDSIFVEDGESKYTIVED
jgi:predicted transcriptional regulator